MSMKLAPACYECKYRRDIPGDCHSMCANLTAHAKGHEHGVKNNWFMWPWNFDPAWLVSCDGFAVRDKP
jgi:hypothetical protein